MRWTVLTSKQSFPINAIAVAWMTFISIVFLFPSTLPTSVGSMNYTVVVFGGTILFSLAWYYFPKVSDWCRLSCVPVS
jgi:hypothetical protein